MRCAGLLLAAIGLFVAGGGQALAQGRAARPTMTTLAGDVLDDYQGQKDLIINAANAMPDDKFTYKSTPAQRDFAAQVMHIVVVNQNMLGTLGAKTPKPTINDKATSKADVMAALATLQGSSPL